MDKKPPTHIMTTTEVRQGQTVGMTRWILLFSLLLVIPGLALVWFFVLR